jgi:hypothetical protein
VQGFGTYVSENISRSRNQFGVSATEVGKHREGLGRNNQPEILPNSIETR